MVRAWGAECDLDGAAGDAAGLLGGRAALLRSRLLRLLLALTGAGGERKGREGNRDDEYSVESHAVFFLSTIGSSWSRNG